MILRYCALALAASAFSAAGRAQVAPAHSSQDQSPYTLHANTQIVLTDITVSDKNGNPVHGLPQTAFRVFDNNKRLLPSAQVRQVSIAWLTWAITEAS